MSSKSKSSVKSSKGATSKGAKKLVKSKHAHTANEGGAFKRVARHRETGAVLKFSALGAFGGRGARTAAIENAIAKAGAKGATTREIADVTSCRAVEMHIRTLYTGARGRKFIDRKMCTETGALRYFALKRPVDVKRPAAAK